MLQPDKQLQVFHRHCTHRINAKTNMQCQSTVLIFNLKHPIDIFYLFCHITLFIILITYFFSSYFILSLRKMSIIFGISTAPHPFSTPPLIPWARCDNIVDKTCGHLQWSILYCVSSDFMKHVVPPLVSFVVGGGMTGSPSVEGGVHDK